MTHPGWTPAPRPGIVPLHPLGFGMILGRSFTALRQNPRVLLGFAMTTQVVGYLAMIVVVGAVAWWSFSRLDTLRENTDEWNAIVAGSTALTIVVGVVMGVAVTALSVIVQGIVVAEVSREVVAEKQTLGQLWGRVKPAAWRLLGYTFLVSLAVGLVVAAVVLALFAIAAAGGAAIAVTIILAVLLVLGAIPLSLWLWTKLAVVPAVLVLERATIGQAIRRSWTLIRGRFWPALGILVIISLTVSITAQIVSVPFSILTSGLSTIIAPTGESGPTAVVALLVGTLITQAVVLLIQAVGLVVQSTAMSLIYVDCRMRHEGLDIDLLEYVEKRDAGRTDLADPYTPHPERPHPPRPLYGYPAPPAGYGPPPGYGVPSAYGAPPAYGTPPVPGAPAYAAPAYGPPPVPTPPASVPPPGYASPPAHGAPPAPPQAPQPAPAPPAPAVPAPPAPTQWTAPGAPAPDEPRDAP